MRLSCTQKHPHELRSPLLDPTRDLCDTGVLERTHPGSILKGPRSEMNAPFFLLHILIASIGVDHTSETETFDSCERSVSEV